MRRYYNIEIAINGGILTVTNVKTGEVKTWKIKVDTDCGYCYQFQKTQVKTIYTDMEKLLDTLSNFTWWINPATGMNVDYSMG